MRTRARGPLARVALVAAVVLAGACTSSPAPTAAPDTSRGDGRRPAEIAASNALLTRVATEGADAVFEQRFGGDLDAGGEAGAFVYVGRTGGEAVVYVCDGTTGTWFTGPVDGDGGGAVRSVDGSASATIAPGEGGVHVRFEGGTFAGRSATAAPLEDGDETLLRLEAPADAGGASAAVGGVIVSPGGVRGVLTVSVTDGTSNTILIGEVAGSKSTDTTAPGSPVLGTSSGSAPSQTRSTTSIADGQSNTISIGEAPGSSTPRTQPGVSLGDGSTRTVDPSGSAVPSTRSTTSIADGQSNTISVGEAPGTTAVGSGAPTLVVSKTSGGVLTISISPTGAGTKGPTSSAVTSASTTSPSTTSTTPASTTTTTTAAAPPPVAAPATTTASCASQVAAIAALIRSLGDASKALARQLDLLRQQRAALAPSAAKDAAARTQLDRLDRSIANVTRQLDQLGAQIDELRRQLPTCR